MKLFPLPMYPHKQTAQLQLVFEKNLHLVK